MRINGTLQDHLKQALNTKYRWALSGTLFDEPSAQRILGYYKIIGDDTIIG